MYKKKLADINSFIIEKAEELSIDALGITSLEVFKDLQTKFPDKGHFISPEKIFPETESLICGALSYNFDWNKKSADTPGYISGYTTANYYKILSKKLKKLGDTVRDAVSPGTPKKDLYRVFVNSRMDDKLAAYACGLGYYMKNSLISVGLKGPRFVIGGLLLSVDLKPFEIIDEDCGTCVMCVENCPTGALKPGGKIDKDICIHHLSSELRWPREINGKSFLEYWGERFFGCSDCVDICPKNSKNQKKDLRADELIGFVGTSADTEKALFIDKKDYKKIFADNQISASWIPAAALARNALAALYNMDKKIKIREYYNKIGCFGWDPEEKRMLSEFCVYLIK